MARGLVCCVDAGGLGVTWCAWDLPEPGDWLEMRMQGGASCGNSDCTLPCVGQPGQEPNARGSREAAAP